jgi:aldehyde dehydrogenase (NAD+)
MTLASEAGAGLRHADRFFIGGQWVAPSSAAQIDVIDSATEEVFLSVAEAQAEDIAAAVTAAREAFAHGPWPRMTHTERAGYLRAIGAALEERTTELGQLWTRESGVLYQVSRSTGTDEAGTFNYYAGFAGAYPFDQPVQLAADPGSGTVIREPVGVVGAIIPWNAALSVLSVKIAPALLAGCTVVLKSSPEAPGEAYILAEAAEAAGLPRGVVNIVTADREVSELLVRDPRVDMITFTGSTAAGRRIASICGERIARCTLELGGKSAAVILDDMDLDQAAQELASEECFLSGQVCSSLTRIIVSRSRHDAMLEALTGHFSRVRVGDPFDEHTQMGPLVTSRQRDRVESYIARGIADGATLATGGGRPQHLDRGYYIEPTVFGNVDNSSVIAQEEIFGPVLCVIPADSEDDAIALANDTIYGLFAAVFTPDAEHARKVARQLRVGSIGHNSRRFDINLAGGGFKQSGINREGGPDGLLPFLETKTIILDTPPEHG